MKTFTVRIREEASDVIRSLPPGPKRMVRIGLDHLGVDPSGRTTGADVKLLATDRRTPRIFRLRAGDWRVVFTVERRVVSVLRVFHRSEGYAWLARLELD